MSGFRILQIMKIKLGFLIMITLLSASCGEQTAGEPENSAASRNLSKKLRENFATAEWFNNVKRVSVRGDKIHVSVDLLNHSDKAREICRQVSDLIYAESPTDRETIIVNNPRGRTITERNGISDACW